MSQLIINLGTADKGNGDVLRTAFTKVNENFAELYNSVSAVVVVGATAPAGSSVGDLWWNSESGRMYVYYGTAWVDASPVDGAGISSTNQLVNSNNTVSLGTDGKLTLPNGAKITPIAFDGINLEIGTKIWNFDADGDLVLPAGGTIRDTVTGNDLLVDLGDWGFRNNVMYSLTGGVIENGDTSHGATSGLTIPTNGDDSPIVLTNTYGNVALVLGASPGALKTWSFGTDGKLTLPAGTTYAYLDAPLTGHGDGLARLDFSLVTDGVSTQWTAASANPAGSGYNIGDTFTFDAEFLGIPGASVTIEVLTIGVGGGVENLAFTQPPLYPADIYRDSPINLQVGPESNRWTFGATGTTTFPVGVSIKSNGLNYRNIVADTDLALTILASGTSGSAAVRWSQSTQQAGIQFNNFGAGNKARATITAANSVNKTWVFDEDGALTFPDSTVQSTAWTGSSSTLTDSVFTIDSFQVSTQIETWTAGATNMSPTDSISFFGHSSTLFDTSWTVSGSGITGQSAITAIDPIMSGMSITGYTVTIAQTISTGLVTGDYVFSNPPSTQGVNITSDLSTWTFGSNGTLTFPDASVIASYKPVTVIAATTTAQTITDSASAAFIQFVETVDTAGAFSPGTFTAPYTGYYQINMSIYFSTTVTLNSGSFLLIDTNLDNTKQVTIINGSWSSSYLHYSTVISATAGDAIRVAFRQVSGGDVEISSGSRLTIHRVSIS